MSSLKEKQTKKAAAHAKNMAKPKGIKHPTNAPVQKPAGK